MRCGLLPARSLGLKPRPVVSRLSGRTPLSATLGAGLASRTSSVAAQRPFCTCRAAAEPAPAPAAEPAQDPFALAESFPPTGATTIDHLPHTQKYVLADEWGFQQVGGSFPSGTPSFAIAGELPEELFARSGMRLAAAFALPLALMVTGYAYLIYWHSICPLAQQLVCWALIGTGYTGLFAIAHDAARTSLFPASRGVNDFIGSLIMAPSLFAFEPWRIKFLYHTMMVNALGDDTDAWHPLTKAQVQQMAMDAAEERAATAAARASGAASSSRTPSPSSADGSASSSLGSGGEAERQKGAEGASTSSSDGASSSGAGGLSDKAATLYRALRRLPPLPIAQLRLALQQAISTTVLKLLASIGGWVKHFDGGDLRNYHYLGRSRVLGSWMWPAAFVGLALPTLMSATGMAGLVTYWLGPWLFFHLWLSTLLMVRNTAPHIPWRRFGDGWDQGMSAVSGCVTATLPAPLEAVINHLNYPLPHQISPAIPFYNTKMAHDWLAARLGPYITTTNLNFKLLSNHITCWQVYDEEKEQYRTLDEVLQEIQGSSKQSEEPQLATASS